MWAVRRRRPAGPRSRELSPRICSGAGFSLPTTKDVICIRSTVRGGGMATISRLWVEEEAQDIAEYAVMLAAILVIVIGTIKLIGSNANNAFSAVASSLQ